MLFVQLWDQSLQSCREPHVSQERSSCLRQFLNFWVSRRSCRLLLWAAPPLFPFCLALTREGAGGDFLATCSSARDWLSANLCTWEEAEDKKHQTLEAIDTIKDRRHSYPYETRHYPFDPLHNQSFDGCFTYCLLVFAELGDLDSLLLHPDHQPLQFALQFLSLLLILGLVDLTHQILMLTDRRKKTKNNYRQIVKSEKEKLNKTIKKKVVLTSSSVRARPAEPAAGLTASRARELFAQRGCRASSHRGKMEKSPSGGFSWLHSSTCAEQWFAHTAGAGGASSCGGYSVRWRAQNGSGWLTVTGREQFKNDNSK